MQFLPVQIKKDQWNCLNQALMNLLMVQSPRDAVANDIYKFFHEMAVHREELIADQIIPQLWQMIGTAHTNPTIALQALGHLPLQPRILSNVVPKLMAILEASGDWKIKMGILGALKTMIQGAEDPLFSRLDIFRRLHSWSVKVANEVGACDNPHSSITACSDVLRVLVASFETKYLYSLLLHSLPVFITRVKLPIETHAK